MNFGENDNNLLMECLLKLVKKKYKDKIIIRPYWKKTQTYFILCKCINNCCLVCNKLKKILCEFYNSILYDNISRIIMKLKLLNEYDIIHDFISHDLLVDKYFRYIFGSLKLCRLLLDKKGEENFKLYFLSRCNIVFNEGFSKYLLYNMKIKIFDILNIIDKNLCNKHSDFIIAYIRNINIKQIKYITLYNNEYDVISKVCKVLNTKDMFILFRKLILNNYSNYVEFLNILESKILQDDIDDIDKKIMEYEIHKYKSKYCMDNYYLFLPYNFLIKILKIISSKVIWKHDIKLLYNYSLILLRFKSSIKYRNILDEVYNTLLFYFKMYRNDQIYLGNFVPFVSYQNKQRLLILICHSIKSKWLITERNNLFLEYLHDSKNGYQLFDNTENILEFFNENPSLDKKSNIELIKILIEYKRNFMKNNI